MMLPVQSPDRGISFTNCAEAEMAEIIKVARENVRIKRFIEEIYCVQIIQ